MARSIIPDPLNRRHALAGELDAARARAVRVLGLVAGEAAINALGQLTTSGGTQTRLSAVRALGETGSAQAVPALQTALTSNDETTARAAAIALVESGRAGVDVLKSFLASSGSSSRARFVQALMRDPVAVSSGFRSQVGQ